MNKYFKEGLLIVISLLPIIYLLIIWEQLPAQVGTHFDLSGNPDAWTNKKDLWLNPGSLPLGIYLLMLIIPKLDPKNKLAQMGDKYYNLRLAFALIFCVLAAQILYSGLSQGDGQFKYTMLIIGFMIAVLGYYFQSIRPNYFIGIRSPWTLESESVWKKTHQLGGKLWMLGGALIVLLSLIFNAHYFANSISIGIIIFIVIVPLVYSYIVFLKEKKELKG